jgi:hypothetical protein
LRLTGPGESTWTVYRPVAGGGLVVLEADGSKAPMGVLITTPADAFVSWGTKRSDWRDHCVVTGLESLAAPLLDALNIV